ncbi:TetR/AcrR family transcriptional regulator [uncultured Methanobrevibacter sp.]|uniref:TetR/AcrR family transcriptional regulator n=1 Tax=uncultured Methanobrevibacter sp. TaxID=253161 RepID=UPI0026122E8A|nr:TetR/AcrR family transcriptional regulator [uncultured Methanobrevibacter sp.]
MNTKDLIVEKTLKLILEKGTIDISIRDIQDCTGLTTGGIYYHFSDKNEIFEAIMQKYIIDYMKIDFDKIPLEGSTKERIHDGLLYILHHFTDGVEIESINENINYGTVLILLTATGYSNYEVNRTVSQIGKDIGIFLNDLVEDGKMKNEIRQDFTTENIAETLYIMYMGVQCFWLDFPNEDIDLLFEKNFEMTWQAIECQ